MIRTAGDAESYASHVVDRFSEQWHALVPAVGRDSGPSIDSWENEGGSYSMTDAPDLEVDSCKKPPAAGVS
jgi:hypothetical protein